MINCHCRIKGKILEKQKKRTKKRRRKSGKADRPIVVVVLDTCVSGGWG
jgi:hypothetical protein